MSTRELRRAGVLARVAAETLTLGSAAALMDVSYRQAKRLYAAVSRGGGEGPASIGAPGRASNRGDARRELRTRVLALIREKYSGGVDERFGPTLAAEHLASEDGITVDHETLRRWMLAAGLWSRARKRSPHRRRRERMAHFGELVQLDGSFHPWFEDRGPHELSADAGGRCDRPEPGAVRARRKRSGRRSGCCGPGLSATGFRARSTPTGRMSMCGGRMQEERETGAEPLTQFGRMCAALGITIIPASSPQAKGRIERNHGTHQDRLVKKLRRQGHCRRRRGERVSRRRLLGGPQSAVCAGARPRRTTFTWRVPRRAALDAGLSARGDADGLE